MSSQTGGLRQTLEGLALSPWQPTVLGQYRGRTEHLGRIHERLVGHAVAARRREDNSHWRLGHLCRLRLGPGSDDASLIASRPILAAHAAAAADYFRASPTAELWELPPERLTLLGLRQAVAFAESGRAAVEPASLYASFQAAKTLGMPAFFMALCEALEELAGGEDGESALFTLWLAQRFACPAGTKQRLLRLAAERLASVPLRAPVLLSLPRPVFGQLLGAVPLASAAQLERALAWLAALSLEEGEATGFLRCHLWLRPGGLSGAKAAECERLAEAYGIRLPGLGSGAVEVAPADSPAPPA